MSTSTDETKLVPTDIVVASKPFSAFVRCLLKRPEPVKKQGVMKANRIAGHFGKSFRVMPSADASTGLRPMQTELAAMSRIPKM